MTVVISVVNHIGLFGAVRGRARLWEWGGGGWPLVSQGECHTHPPAPLVLHSRMFEGRGRLDFTKTDKRPEGEVGVPLKPLHRGFGNNSRLFLFSLSGVGQLPPRGSDPCVEKIGLSGVMLVPPKKVTWWFVKACLPDQQAWRLTLARYLFCL